MPLDEIGVKQAVVALYKNDPFYPRLGRDDIRDQRLWNAFKFRFIVSREAMLDRGSPEARPPLLRVNLVKHIGQL